MPEVAELKHSRDLIRHTVKGRWVTKIDLLPGSRFFKKTPDNYTHFSGSLPARVIDVNTRGKFMWWTLETRAGTKWKMWCTYGMSGQWSTQQTKHTGCSIEFVDLDNSRRSLHFNDPRHFGTLKFTKDEKEHGKKLASLGPCILESPPTPEKFAELLLRKPSRIISEALMDQSCVAGVGNYIRAEVMYRSGISPWRKSVDLSSEEWRLLHRETLAVCQESYVSQGASISTYRTVDGQRGSTQFYFRAYGKDSCPKGHPIRREEGEGGRTLHWCPECQK